MATGAYRLKSSKASPEFVLDLGTGLSLLLSYSLPYYHFGEMGVNTRCMWVCEKINVLFVIAIKKENVIKFSLF